MRSSKQRCPVLGEACRITAWVGALNEIDLKEFYQVAAEKVPEPHIQVPKARSRPAQSGIRVLKWRRSRIQVAEALPGSCPKWRSNEEVAPKPHPGCQSIPQKLTEGALRRKSADKATHGPKV